MCVYIEVHIHGSISNMKPPAELWFLFLNDFFGNNNSSARELPRSFRED